MSVQRDVAQQNHDTSRKIREAAASFRSGSPSLLWLRGVLEAHHLSPEAGLLVDLAEVVEQEGQQFHGVWLTTSRQFWQFVVMVSRDYTSVLEVEEFDEVTNQTVVSAHVLGTGRSFGYLALQALGEQPEG